MLRQLSTSIEANRKVNAVALVLQRLLELGVSKSELARLLGVDRSSIYKWLKGVHKPSKVELWRIERIFDLLENRLAYDYYSKTHGGPPSNYFSFKVDFIPREVVTSDPAKLAREIKREIKSLKACLSKLTFLAGILNITYKVLLDDAALMIREYLKKNKVKIKNASELALAALRIASARVAYKLDEVKLNQLLNEEFINKELYKQFVAELAGEFL